MLNIAVDTSELNDLIRALNPNTKGIAKVLDAAGTFVSDALESVGYGAMFDGMTRKVNNLAFSASVYHHVYGNQEVVISANPTLSDSIQGQENAFDMKSGLLSGPKSKTSKDGTRYNIIPFSHQTSGLSDQALSALANNVRNFQTNIGLRTKLLPNGSMAHMGNNQFVKSGGIDIPVSSYTWTTGHESGIQMGANGPVTFRTVSDRSNPASWWYPAKQENPVFEAVWNATKNDVEQWILNAWWEVIGFGSNSG